MSKELIERVEYLKGRVATLERELVEQNQLREQTQRVLDQKMDPFPHVQFCYEDGEDHGMGSEPVMYVRRVPQVGEIVELETDDGYTTIVRWRVTRLVNRIDRDPRMRYHTIEVYVTPVDEKGEPTS